MSEKFEMTLAEATAAHSYLSRLAYPSKWESELLRLATERVHAEQDSILDRFREFKLNTQERSGTAREAPSTNRDGTTVGAQPVAQSTSDALT